MVAWSGRESHTLMDAIAFASRPAAKCAWRNPGTWGICAPQNACHRRANSSTCPGCACPRTMRMYIGASCHAGADDELPCRRIITRVMLDGKRTWRGFTPGTRIPRVPSRPKYRVRFVTCPHDTGALSELTADVIAAA